MPHDQWVYQVVRRGLQLIGILPHHYAEVQPEVDSLQLQARQQDFNQRSTTFYAWSLIYL